APVMLWLNGGPGCSSLDGFIYEHGPFRLDPKDPAKLVRFDFTWAKLANVIYLEGPVGVGFSYSDDETDYSKCNDDTTAEDNLAAVNLFFERYPNFRNNDFFIAGESYAGVYVPTLAEALLRAQDAGNYTGAPLRGISVGNGCIGSEVGVCSGGANRDRFEIPYLLGTAFLPEALKKRVRDGCDFEMTGPFLGDTCDKVVKEVYDTVGHVNIYNVYGKCEGSGSRQSGRQKVPLSLRGNQLGGPDACIDSSRGTAYFNLENVKAALHVKSDLSWEWDSCANPEGWSYNRTRANLPRDTYPFLLGRLRVLIYNGDWDASVPYTDNEAWTKALSMQLGLAVTQPWSPWVFGFDGQVGGYRQDYTTAVGPGAFSFATVRGGRHEESLMRAGSSEGIGMRPQRLEECRKSSVLVADFEFHINATLSSRSAEVSRLQSEAELLGGTSQKEVHSLRAELREKEEKLLEVSALKAELVSQRAGGASAAAASSEAKEQVRALRAELQEQRGVAAEEAHRLRSELWDEKSAASAAAVANAGEVASLRAAAQAAAAAASGASSSGQSQAASGSSVMEAALRAELAERRRCNEEEVQGLQADLRQRGEAAREEARNLRTETASAERQAEKVRSDEELEVRKAREDLKESRERLAAAEAVLLAHEDRAKRFGTDLESERHEGESRVQRLRGDVRRLEQELDEASTRARNEARRRDE
ncbi:unnamed protein product, partial [Polarella glacialis]